MKKHAILIGILISVILLFIATIEYPGGSPIDDSAIGYNWKHNYISNLFAEKAINGLPNEGRFWAMGGMIFLSISLSIFFVQFSKRIPKRGAANVVKYLGILGMLFTFLIATPMHDLMVTIASTLFLVCMGSGAMLEHLPIIQKLLFASTIVLILGLHYFTEQEDFQQVKKIVKAGSQ